MQELHTVHKLWVARARRTDEEFDHDIPGKLYVFYDTPIYNQLTHSWEGARCIGELPNYMFPEIEEGICIQFENKKQMRKHLN